MKRPLLALFAVLTLLALSAGGWFIYRVMSASPDAGAPASGEAAGAQRVQTVNGETTVQVPPDEQRASGIAVAPLAAASLRPERQAYAAVVDLQPLFDFGNRLAAARAERDAAAAQAAAAQAQAARMRTLYGDDRNVSQKSLQDAEAAARAAQARLRAAESVLAGIEAAARQQFGPALAGAAADSAANSASGLLRRLARGAAAVARVTLPPSGPPAAPERVTLDVADGRALAAARLSAAPQIDPAIQGASWFYLVESSLPAGARMTARWSADPSANPSVASGVLIPESAVVWYGDQRWVYVRTAADRFTRRLVPDGFSSGAGIVAAGGLRAGDEVATRGAQLLLSEEQRPQGVATQCKDPPECDG